MVDVHVPLVLKARHLSGSAFCWVDIHIGLPEQAVGGFPLGLGLVVEDKPTELSCTSFKLRSYILFLSLSLSLSLCLFCFTHK